MVGMVIVGLASGGCGAKTNAGPIVVGLFGWHKLDYNPDCARQSVRHNKLVYVAEMWHGVTDMWHSVMDLSHISQLCPQTVTRSK
jgi:hypothetical protein